MNKKQKSLNNKGFSLVELIIVIAIMAVLIGVLAPQYIGYVNKSKVSTDLQNAEALATKIAVVAADVEAGTSSATVASANYIAIPTTGTNKLVDTVPAVKAQASSSFVYKYTDNTVYVGVKDASDNVTELYPTRPTTGTYAAN